VSDYLPAGRVVDRPPEGGHVRVVHRPGAVDRVSVDALNEYGELERIPAGRVHEVAVREDGEDRAVQGPYDGTERACEVAATLADREGLPLVDGVERVLPDVEERERRSATGRWPPRRDERRPFEAELPAGVDVSPESHDVCLRVLLDPDPDPPAGDDAPPAAFDDRYDVVLAHNTTTGFEVVETVECGLRSRDRAVDRVVEAARERGWPVVTTITPPAGSTGAPGRRNTD